MIFHDDDPGPSDEDIANAINEQMAEILADDELEAFMVIAFRKKPEPAEEVVEKFLETL